VVVLPSQNPKHQKRQGVDMEHHRYLDALHGIPADLPRADWFRVLCAAKSAGISVDEARDWSATAPDVFVPAAFASTWKSIKPGEGATEGTLIHIAKEHGWKQRDGYKPPPPKPAPVLVERQIPADRTAKAIYGAAVPCGLGAEYPLSKNFDGLLPPEGVRLWVQDKPIPGLPVSCKGSLLVPVTDNGELVSLQIILSGEAAAYQKANGKPTKLNLAGHTFGDGWFVVGELEGASKVCIAEGFATAWTAHLLSGHPAIVSFGVGRTKRMLERIKRELPNATPVIVPDLGQDLRELATEYGAELVTLPDGADNGDLNDLWQADPEAAAVAIQSAKPVQPEGKYRLLSPEELRTLPKSEWFVKGVLPRQGVAAIIGPSKSGKSFLAMDMLWAIASGEESWFGYRVKPGQCVYIGLEGAPGVYKRIEALSRSKGGQDCPFGVVLPESGYSIVCNDDHEAMVRLIPKGALVVVDTMARAATGVAENDVEGMSRIIAGAERISRHTGATVLLVHHTGKDQTKGARGHSSLLGALDGEISVCRDESSKKRSWQVSKAKDSADGAAYSFELSIVELGIDEDGDTITSCVIVPGEACTPTGPKPKGRPNKTIAAVERYLVSQSAGVKRTQVVDAMVTNKVCCASSAQNAINDLVLQGRAFGSVGIVAASSSLRAEYASRNAVVQ
jgi:putative DNA primase/helicase